MEPDLQHILERLRVMQTDYSARIQERNFDLFGVNVCRVTYDHQTMLFAINEQRIDGTFIFDEIDLAAIEVFNHLVDFQLVF